MKCEECVHYQPKRYIHPITNISTIGMFCLFPKGYKNVKRIKGICQEFKEVE